MLTFGLKKLFVHPFLSIKLFIPVKMSSYKAFCGKKETVCSVIRFPVHYLMMFVHDILTLATLLTSLNLKSRNQRHRKSPSHLDFYLKYNTKVAFRTKLIYKRAYFDFPVVNITFMYNITAASAQDVQILYSIRFYRICDSYQ